MGGEAAAHFAFPKTLGDAVERVPTGRGLGAVEFDFVIAMVYIAGTFSVGGGRVAGVHRCYSRVLMEVVDYFFTINLKRIVLSSFQRLSPSLSGRVAVVMVEK
mmetsp:Transcript_17636/g.35243  ORF Transcript_17636/g.35243 Transcript_17636/m.35243 type:complete len:103 (+) Transcript_17636:2393-2701(+)